MNIAIMSEYVASLGDPLYGGVDARVINLGLELAKRNEVHIVTSLQKGQEKIEQHGNMTIHRVGKERPFVQRGHRLERLDFNRKGAKELQKIRPDVIEASGFVAYAGAMEGGRTLAKPAMVTVHEVWQGQWIHNMGVVDGVLGNVLERFSLRKPFDRYIAVSDFTKDRLVRLLGIRPEQVCVIRSGVDRAFFDSVKVDGKYEEPSIVTVSRLVPYKKIDLLIRAVDNIRKITPDVKLRIIGIGAEEMRLRQLVSELRLNDNVEFLGKIADPRELIGVMKRSTVMAHPSVMEGLGLVVVEAMASGLPYVASDLVPIREITKGGVGGKLFRPMDLADLTNKLQDTLTEGNGHRDHRTSELLDEFEWKNLALSYEKEVNALLYGAPNI